MDHLIQIPQVDRAWEPIPEPWSPSACSPVSTRTPAGHAGLPRHVSRTRHHSQDRRNARRAQRWACLLRARRRWWLREHQAYGLDFPSDRQRLDQLQVCIETLRALWAPGTKPYHGRYVHLPETTCYPRPVSDVPIIVGGSGERRTLRIAAEQADAATCLQTKQYPRSTFCGGIAQCWAATPQAWRSPYWTCR